MKRPSVLAAFLMRCDNLSNQGQSQLQEALEASPFPHSFY
jgi:hypothetical protein